MSVATSRKGIEQTSSVCQEKPTGGHNDFFLSAMMFKFNKRIL